MEKYMEILSRCPLFAGISREDIGQMLSCLNGNVRELSKGSYVFLEGEPARFVGVVLSGAVQVVRDDYYGHRSILAQAEPGELFGEVFSCAELDTLPVSILCVKDCQVLMLDCKRMLTVCSNVCRFHSMLVQNLLRIVSEKNVLLSQKIRYMSQRTTQRKLMDYLMDQAKLRGSPEFTIPYDRQALADFLGVERSAMSAELGKLKKAGILDFQGARFSLKQPL